MDRVEIAADARRRDARLVGREHELSAIRSQIDVRQPSPLGEYNYEYKLNPSSIPGNTVAGTYVLYVLDGTGERDSQDITINVPEGQGEVWIEFDQN